MSTMERDPERADNQVPSAVGEPGGGATGPGARPLRRAAIRTLLLTACAGGLGFAAGSWAGPTVDQATPEEPSAGGEDGTGCAEVLLPGDASIGIMRGLPPGHPPIGIMQGLPPGHPPVRALPRLPAGHPPIPSAPPPALLFQQAQPFTI
jgi:hypothetical protein